MSLQQTRSTAPHLAGGGAETAEVYTIDATHSEVSFQVRHLVTRVRGRFTEFEGTIDFRPDDLAASSVELAVRAGSIDTDLPDRDEHLRSEDFFWVERYPEISFRSTRVEDAGADRFLVTGELTLRGVTREIHLEVDFLGSALDPWGNKKAGFATATSLDRKAYGMVWNMALDQGGVILGDRVAVTVNIESLARREEA